MARPKQDPDKKTVQLTFVIEEKYLGLIDYYAEKLDLTRSKFIRNLVLSGLDDTKLMNSLGILQLVTRVRKGGVQPSLPMFVES